MKIKFLLFFALNFFTLASFSQCKDSLADYVLFRGKWNKHVEIFRAGTWKLPPIDCSFQSRDTFDVNHPLERAGIKFLTTLTKQGCINKASILVKKEDDLEVEGLVGMMYLIELFNPELSSSARQKILSDLKFESEEKKDDAAKVVGKNTYVFKPGLIVNVLTVVVGS